MTCVSGFLDADAYGGFLRGLGELGHVFIVVNPGRISIEARELHAWT